jgi:ketosteroid isomerase-like protein
VTTNAEIIRAASGAVVQGDALALMGYLASDVRWQVHSAEPDAAPWFGVYRGKRGVLQFLEDIAAIGPVEITERALVAEGDLVVTWVHVKFRGPTGRVADMDEAHFWRLVDGRIVTVDIMLDTAAVAAAFA